MTDEQMLAKLKLTRAELHDFLERYDDFVCGLDPAQRTLISNSLPTMEQALASFGPGATAEDLTRLFSRDEQHPPGFLGTIGRHHHK